MAAPAVSAPSLPPSLPHDPHAPQWTSLQSAYPSKPDSAYSRPDSAYSSAHIPRRADRGSPHSNTFAHPYPYPYPYPYTYPHRPRSVTSHHSHRSHPSTQESPSVTYPRPYDPRYSSPRLSAQHIRRDSSRPNQSRYHSDSSGQDSAVTEKSSAPLQDEDTHEVHHSTYSEDDDEKLVETLPTRHIAQALIHVSLLAPLLSIGIAIYAVVALVYATLSLPFGFIIPKRPSFRKNAGALLAAPLRFQLRCVFASTSQVEVRDEEKQHTWPGQPSNQSRRHLSERPATLMLTHAFAPLASIPIALCAWVVAFFWVCSAIVNDEGGNGDGRSLAITVIDWWIWWLEGRMFR